MPDTPASNLLAPFLLYIFENEKSNKYFPAIMHSYGGLQETNKTY